MSDDAVGAEKVGGVIPFFFYDIFSHIVPGAFLIVSAAWLALNDALYELLSKPFANTVNRAPIAGPTVWFLVFLIAAFFVGFILGAVSHIAESLWNVLAPYSLEDLRQWLGGRRGDPVTVETAIHERFGISLRNEQSAGNNLVECSFLCWNFVYFHNPGLAIVATKWDAEALLSRSVFFAGTGLAVWAFAWHLMLGFGVLAPIGLGAFLAFRYHRKKRVFGRIALFDLTNSHAYASRPEAGHSNKSR